MYCNNIQSNMITVEQQKKNYLELAIYGTQKL